MTVFNVMDWVVLNKTPDYEFKPDWMTLVKGMGGVIVGHHAENDELVLVKLDAGYCMYINAVDIDLDQ